jgi:hypothetical protein
LAAKCFVAEQDVARSRLYRMQLQASVNSINRLALIAAKADGHGPDDVAAMLTPPPDWPWRLLGGFSMAAAWWTAADMLGHRSARTRPSPQYAGTVTDEVRSVAVHAEDDLHFGVGGACIGISGRFGPGYLYTLGGSASLEMAHDLPHSVVAALPGRAICDLLAHPLLEGRPYVITSAGRAPWGHLRVEFATGVEPVTLPWADLLRGGRHA